MNIEHCTVIYTELAHGRKVAAADRLLVI